MQLANIFPKMCISLSSNDPCLRTKSGSIMYIGHSKKGNEDCNQTDTGTTESEGFIPDEDVSEIIIIDIQ